MVSPVVTCKCESWTTKKAEGQRIDYFKLWCWKRLLRVPWTARSNQSILKEINPEYSLEGLLLKLKLQQFGASWWSHLCGGRGFQTQGRGYRDHVCKSRGGQRKFSPYHEWDFEQWLPLPVLSGMHHPHATIKRGQWDEGETVEELWTSKNHRRMLRVI